MNIGQQIKIPRFRKMNFFFTILNSNLQLNRIKMDTIQQKANFFSFLYFVEIILLGRPYVRNNQLVRKLFLVVLYGSSGHVAHV